MNKSVKVTTAVLLSVGLLAGCGATNNNNGGTNTGEGSKEEKITLNVWGMGEEAKALPTIAEDFTKENPNISIKVQALPWGQGHDKLLTAVASKKGPDVVQLGSSWTLEFGSAGALADMAPYIEQYPELNMDNFFPGAVESAQIDGTFVGIPWYVDTRVLYYRTDLLKEVGYEQAPATWEELSDAAQKLAARGEGQYGISIDPKEQSLGFMYARQNGAEWFTEDGQPNFTDEKFVEAVEYIASFYKNGSAPKDLGLDIIPAFNEGITPMFISGPWMIKLISDQAPELEGKWGMAVLPNKENNISLLGGSHLSIFEYSEHKDAAAKFVAYMSKPETQLKWHELSKTLPSTTAAWEADVLKNDPHLSVYGKQLEAAMPMPVIPAWEQLGQTYVKYFENIYRANKDVAEMMEAFNQEAVKLMK